ncbi:MAG TPA: HAD-IC family P-type ATPase, partial [Chitinophagaceae bacterium]|nr:HAD-IC family P-type ATPase [Chitinophagaceae bacterium]
MEVNFWKYNTSEILQQVKSSENGLSAVEAGNRLRSSATNKKQTAGWKKDVLLFLSQYKSPLVLMLVAAVILSAFAGEQSDVIIILFILLATGLLSFIQERNAGRTVEKLRAMIAVKCVVLRTGLSVTIPATEIVNGDILLIKAGDIVPADCYLLESNELYSNEASLTGESFPARKEPGIIDENAPLAKRTNCLWQGSSISSGTGKAVVINTGEQTIFGGIAKSASGITETAFEKGIRRFGYFLMQVTLILSVAILTINLFLHKPVVDSLLFALALAVGMAPELLPAINAIAMSAGAKRLLHKKVIVKKLSAIQNLGEVNLLCTDKTGTITQGIIQIAKSCDATGTDSSVVQQLAFINASFESGYANPIDEALKRLPVTIPPDTKKVGEIPYDFIRKRLTI